jgi:hypothetical protein
MGTYSSGTHASPFRNTPTTVVSEMANLIAKDENVVPGYGKGVGTKGGKIDKIFGGGQTRVSMYQVNADALIQAPWAQGSYKMCLTALVRLSHDQPSSFYLQAQII